MSNRTPEQIARDYAAMLDSVTTINAALADTSTHDRARVIARNVAHLELMRARSDWTNQDMRPVNAAIAAGKA